jgi:hypothetical protein
MQSKPYLPLILLLTLSGCINNITPEECSGAVSIQHGSGKHLLASIEECSDRLLIDAHEGVELSELVSLQSFGPLTPEVVQDGTWMEVVVDRPVLVEYEGGLLWSWKEGDYARQILGRVNQESDKWYYLLRLDLGNQPMDDILSPEVLEYLPPKAFGSIEISCSNGYSVVLKKKSDGLFLYWYWSGRQ